MNTRARVLMAGGLMVGLACGVSFRLGAQTAPIVLPAGAVAQVSCASGVLTIAPGKR